jgi:hypothetical protein
MKQHYGFCVAVLLFLHVAAYSQAPAFTANSPGAVPPYTGYFMYGTNGGWFGTSWDDKSLADIAAGNPSKNVKGVGSKTFRPPLPEEFLEFWGYDVRISEFNHYITLGAREFTVMLNTPSAAHRDNNTYGGCSDQSRMFSNMYEPIWDGGANGTPVNDNNYYALYVYKTVTRYKSYVRFWEIMNEPDFDIGGGGWRSSGQADNWWDANPNPCHLANMKAPVFNYIRMLRISYEVIKSIDPTAYVATGGIGYYSFLDAILRNTDNPNNGAVTAEYPLKGGAYFDVLSFHNYPQYNLATWDNGVGGFVYTRHSDAAANSYISVKNAFVDVLNTHGYNGTTFPQKHVICTENNIPKKAVGDMIGSDETQMNYIIKALVLSQQNDIKQYYCFMLGDDKTLAEATDGFQTMGLYQKLEGVGPLANGGVYGQQFNNEGIAYKTTSDILLYSRYNATRTAAMNLPSGIGGAAFTNDAGDNVYVLWAKTTIDQTELASATYTFPAGMNVLPQLIKREWNFTITGATSTLSSSNIALTGTPIFLTETLTSLPVGNLPGQQPGTEEKNFALSLYPNPVNTVASMKFTLRTPAKVRINIYNAQGQFVANAVNGRSFGSGTHVVSLPVSQQLPAGVYYCRFETEIMQVLKKMVIVR